MENQENENVEAEIVDISVIEAQDKAIIDSQIATAQRFPRNVKRSTEDSIAIITMSKEIAETCHYAVPRGGVKVSGPSIHLAKIIAQNWGNMRIEAKVIGIDKTHITSQAIAFDLQKNIAFKVEVKRSIVGKTGRFSEDMITVTGNAANAIAMRNAIFNVIPRGVVDACYKAAKNMITGDVSNEAKMIAKRKEIVDGLKDSYSVSEKEILDSIGKGAISNITVDDIVYLIGIWQAIKDGDTTVELAFKGGVKTKAEVETKKADLKKKQGKQESAKETKTAENKTQETPKQQPKKEEITFEKVKALYDVVSPALTPQEVKEAKETLGMNGEMIFDDKLEKLYKLLNEKAAKATGTPNKNSNPSILP